MTAIDHRPLTRLAALAGVLALAAGCGGVGGSDASPGGGAVSLTMMGFATGDEIAKTRFDLATKAIAPGTAKAAEGAFNAQQFLSAVASGTAPDLVYMDRQLIGTYAAKGAIVPLDSCIKDEKIDMGQYRKAAVAEVTLAGKVYGLPEFYDNRLLMATEQTQVRTEDWTALAATTASLTRKGADGKLARIGFDPKIPEFLPMWAKANGADLVAADGRTAQLDDPKVVEALTYTTDLVKAQGGWSAFKSFRDSFDFFGAKNEFASDQLGAFPMEDWYINSLAQNSPQVKLVVTPFLGRDGKPVDWVTGNAWAIPAKAPHAAEACRWIKTATATDSWIAAAKARAEARQKDGKPFVGVFTGNEKADETIFRDIVKPTGNAAFDNAVKVVLQTQDSAFAAPALAAGEEFKAAWTGAVNRVLNGQQQPTEALAQAQKEAQSALDKANTK
ncbi:extracellular solute-binding protein [Dactylosporangium sp. CS-047395]|uniref:extracellular solute-binding protein n=1 Tax=Dactylosporangium sp. CS-047395 TaxID=3239936 RepID=UPI003D92BDDE